MMAQVKDRTRPTGVRPEIRQYFNDEAGAKRYVRGLIDAELDFHFDDDPADIIDGRTDQWLFSEDECVILRDRKKKLFDLLGSDKLFEHAMSIHRQRGGVPTASVCIETNDQTAANKWSVHFDVFNNRRCTIRMHAHAGGESKFYTLTPKETDELRMYTQNPVADFWSSELVAGKSVHLAIFNDGHGEVMVHEDDGTGLHTWSFTFDQVEIDQLRDFFAKN